ncbi:MAG: tetratricopeptide repeat protein [Leptolyngbya sp. SIO1D8]|nr:tetratricopeptide repeat protein [Leptolyngbya sp. SIO1D8]
MKILPAKHLGLLVALAIASGFVALPSQGAEIDQQLIDITSNDQTQEQRQARDVADQLLRLGQQEIEDNNYERGINAWYRAIDIYIALGDFPAAGIAYDYISQTYADLGQYLEAEDAIRRRLAIAQDYADFRGQVYGFNNLGSVLLQRGHLRQAEEAFQVALVIAEDIEDPASMGISLSNLGLLARIQGDLAGAQDYYEAATNYRLRAGDLVGQAYSSNSLGRLYLELGEEGQALGAFLVARRAANEAGHIPTLLVALDGLIDIYRDRDDLTQTQQYLDERIALTEGAEANPAQQLGTLIQLGQYYEQLGDPRAAQEAYQQALVLAQQLEDVAKETFLVNRIQVVQFQPSTVNQ